jgi:hypothetical protein
MNCWDWHKETLIIVYLVTQRMRDLDDILHSPPQKIKPSRFVIEMEVT